MTATVGWISRAFEASFAGTKLFSSPWQRKAVAHECHQLQIYSSVFQACGRICLPLGSLPVDRFSKETRRAFSPFIVKEPYLEI